MARSKTRPSPRTRPANQLKSNTKRVRKQHRAQAEGQPSTTAQLRLDLRSPSPWARLPTPVAAKSGSVPTHERLGPDDCENDGEVTLAGVGSVMPGMGASCWRITAHIEFQASE
jgi:hypothetical protein